MMIYSMTTEQNGFCKFASLFCESVIDLRDFSLFIMIVLVERKKEERNKKVETFMK